MKNSLIIMLMKELDLPHFWILEDNLQNFYNISKQSGWSFCTDYTALIYAQSLFCQRYKKNDFDKGKDEFEKNLFNIMKEFKVAFIEIDISSQQKLDEDLNKNFGDLLKVKKKNLKKGSLYDRILEKASINDYLTFKEMFEKINNFSLKDFGETIPKLEENELKAQICSIFIAKKLKFGSHFKDALFGFMKETQRLKNFYKFIFILNNFLFFSK